MILSILRGCWFLQDENKEGGKTSQLPVSGIGKGLTLGNLLKFYFGMVSHGGAKDTQLFGHEWH